jgi:subtilisin-like proprotein convertase family protein
MTCGTSALRRLALSSFALLAFAAMPVLAQQTYSATVNQPIPDGTGNGTSGAPLVSTITVAGAPPAVQLLQVRLDITHTWVGDVRAQLTSPAGTSVWVINRPGVVNPEAPTGFGCSGDNINALFNDAAPGSAETSCLSPGGLNAGPYNIQPQSFAVFNGENPNGNWTMTVTDWAGGDTGTFNSWSLQDVIFIPVELTSFTATSAASAIMLNWNTASETNNAGFEVEARRAGETTFQTLGFVAGKGTTTEAQAYSFTAEGLAFGSHFFRLRQVDFDGTFAYSDEVEATLEVPGTHALSAAYPNPFNPQTRFELAVQREQNVTVSVYDAIGRQVATLFQGSLPANESRTLTFEAANLPSGTYMIRAVGDNFQQTQRVTLLK